MGLSSVMYSNDDLMFYYVVRNVIYEQEEIDCNPTFCGKILEMVFEGKIMPEDLNEVKKGYQSNYEMVTKTRKTEFEFSDFQICMINCYRQLKLKVYIKLKPIIKEVISKPANPSQTLENPSTTPQSTLFLPELEIDSQDSLSIPLTKDQFFLLLSKIDTHNILHLSEESKTPLPEEESNKAIPVQKSEDQNPAKSKEKQLKELEEKYIIEGMTMVESLISLLILEEVYVSHFTETSD